MNGDEQIAYAFDITTAVTGFHPLLGSDIYFVYFFCC